MKIRSAKTIFRFNLWLSMLLVINTVSCFHKREIERYQALNTLSSVADRLSATHDFIRDYPKSDSLFPAMKSALELLEKSGDSDQTLQFALNQRLIQPDQGIRQFLNRILFEKLALDSLGKTKFVSDTEEFHQIYPDKLAFAITVMPHLNSCFQSDSIRNQALYQFGNIVLQSDNDLIIGLKTLSDQVLQLNDSLLIPLSNQFLVHALKNNARTTVHKQFPDAAEPDSIQNQNYYTLYTALAWNTYRQRRFSYALNLMSQATKYGNLEDQDGYIILGAVQSQCGELSDGWANVLKGLILNSEAEKQSVEIEHLYTAMFYRIRGSRENPSRFLSQYRHSHR